MAQKHILAGLMKWSQRDEWAELFDELLDRHAGSACDEMGVDMEELPDILEPHQNGTLFGCVFEDLIASDIDGNNIADDYLKRRGWKESATARNHIRALRQSVMSLYEVSGIRRDEGFFLRDLIRGGEPFWVHEKRATHGLTSSVRLGARVVTINGRAELGGALLPFSEAQAAVLVAELEQLAKATPADVAQALTQMAVEAGEPLDEEWREIIEAVKQDKTETTIDDILAIAASVFTSRWLEQVLEETPGHDTIEPDDMPDDAEDAAQHDLFDPARFNKRARAKLG